MVNKTAGAMARIKAVAPKSFFTDRYSAKKKKKKKKKKKAMSISLKNVVDVARSIINLMKTCPFILSPFNIQCEKNGKVVKGNSTGH